MAMDDERNAARRKRTHSHVMEQHKTDLTAATKIIRLHLCKNEKRGLKYRVFLLNLH
jgi:hypothetical protein